MSILKQSEFEISDSDEKMKIADLSILFGASQ